MNPFASALRQLMDERGVSQRRLAERLGITASAVNFWCQGTSRPTRDNVIALEDELAVEPRGTLLHLADYRADGTDPDPTVESLIRSDPGLHAEDKRVLLRVLLLARERQGFTRQRSTTAAEVAELEQVAEVNRRRRKGVPLGS